MKVFLIWSEQSDIEVSDVNSATKVERSVEVEMTQDEYNMFCNIQMAQDSAQQVLHNKIMGRQ